MQNGLPFLKDVCALLYVQCGFECRRGTVEQSNSMVSTLEEAEPYDLITADLFLANHSYSFVIS